MRPSVLAGLVALVLSGAGCLATRPFVRTEVQKSDARTQQQLETVDLRLDAVERELKEERARLATLDADLHQTRGVVEDTAKQAAQTRELAIMADGAARDALQAVSRSPTPKMPKPGPVAATPGNLRSPLRIRPVVARPRGADDAAQGPDAASTKSSARGEVGGIRRQRRLAEPEPEAESAPRRRGEALSGRKWRQAGSHPDARDGRGLASGLQSQPDGPRPEPARRGHTAPRAIAPGGP